MDPIGVALLNYALIGIGFWAATISAGIVGNIIRGSRGHQRRRKSDLFQLLTTFALAATAFTVVFVHPGLIHLIPSTIAVLEIGSILPLLYLSEKHMKDWARLCKTLKQPATYRSESLD